MNVLYSYYYYNVFMSLMSSVDRWHLSPQSNIHGGKIKRSCGNEKSNTTHKLSH